MTKKKIRRYHITGDRLLIKIKPSLDERNIRRNNNGLYEEFSPDTGFIKRILTEEQADLIHLSTSEGWVVQIGRNAYKGIGDGHRWVNIGDLVTINKWSGVVINIGDGEIYREISDEDVMGYWIDENLNDIPDYLVVPKERKHD